MSRHARNTAVFSALTLLSRVTGLLRQAAIVSLLDVSRFADAYQLAYMLPFMLYEFVVGGLLSAVVMPILVRAQQEHGKTSAQAWRVANLVMGTVGLILGILSLLILIFAPQVTYALTFLNQGNSAEASRELVTFFVRFFAPQVFLIGVNAVCQAILNSHDAFAVTGAAPVANNLVQLAAIGAFWLGWLNIAGLAIGTTGAVAAMTLMMLFSLRRLGMRLRPRFDFRDPAFGTMASLGKPLVAVSVANFIGTAIRANILWTVAGGYAAFTACFTMVMTPYGIFAVSIATVLFPAMSRAVSAADEAEFSRTLSLGLRWTTLAIAPVAVAMSLLAEPIVRVVFERGNVTYADSLMVASVLRWYAPAILPYSLVIFLTRAFYARNNTLTPALINICGVVANTVLNFVLMKRFGVPGVAMAAGITYAGTTLMSVVLIRRELSAGQVRVVGWAALKIGTATAAMTAVMWTGLFLTQPDVVVLESGSRYPAPIRRQDPLGDYAMIRNSGDWQALWMRLETQIPPPEIDWEKRRIVALFGPQTRTTTTLTLQPGKDDPNTSGIRIRINRPPDWKEKLAALAPDSPTSPSYMLLSVPAEQENVPVSFEVHTLEKERGTWAAIVSLLKVEGLVRLILLGLLGMAVFFGTALLLRTEELVSLWKVVAGKLRRKRSG